MKRLGILAILLSLISACGTNKEPAAAPTRPTQAASTATPSVPTTSTAVTPTLALQSDDRTEEAKRLEIQIPQIVDVITMTEDNDKNNLIGRPGQYDAASFMADKRLGCHAAGHYDGLSIDCGAKIERWPSEADAKTRMKDIQDKLKTYGLGAEWDYVRGRLLLRLAGELKPPRQRPTRRHSWDSQVAAKLDNGLAAVRLFVDPAQAVYPSRCPDCCKTLMSAVK
jgi:hypothetical protein